MAHQQLHKAVVVVKDILPAAAGRSGRIKTDLGFFGVWPDKMPLLEKGRRYAIDFTAVQKGNVVFRDVQKVQPATPPANDAEGPETPAPQQATPRKQIKQPEPHNGNDPYWRPKPRDPEEREQIFVAMGLKTDIEMGRVGPSEDDLVERIGTWRHVWARTFGADHGEA